MRIATWNVNGLRARLDLVLHWLASRRPDVVGIQEIKTTEDQFPLEAIREAGYHALVNGQKGWNGVAILARDEPQIVQRDLPGQEAHGARLITARVGALTFTSVYVPNGKSVDHEDFPRKLAWIDAFIDHVGSGLESAEGPVVIGGDFNICPAPLDSWDEQALRGSIFHTDAERDRFRRILATGLRDLFREKWPAAQAFSWWDYRGGAFHRGRGLRIDFLLASADLLPRVRSVTIDRDYRKKIDGMTPSDHVPVMAEWDGS